MTLGLRYKRGKKASAARLGVKTEERAVRFPAPEGEGTGPEGDRIHSAGMIRDDARSVAAVALPISG